MLYIGGGFMVTFLANVPMNEKLARVGEVGPAALAQVRAEYEGPWNFWNGVRAVFSSLAFVAPSWRLPLAIGLAAHVRWCS